jgi:hypothetical protein
MVRSYGLLLFSLIVFGSTSIDTPRPSGRPWGSVFLREAVIKTNGETAHQYYNNNSE